MVVAPTIDKYSMCSWKEDERLTMFAYKRHQDKELSVRGKKTWVCAREKKERGAAMAAAIAAAARQQERWELSDEILLHVFIVSFLYL